MDSKNFLILLALIHYSYSAGMLRRTPKVYNALITTDDNLQSSRAFPVIQPTIHETGIAHYPFGTNFNPYRFYSPPLVHGPPHQPYSPNAQVFPSGPQGFPTGPQNSGNGPQPYPTGPQNFNMGPPSEQSGFPHFPFSPHGPMQYPQNQPGFQPHGQFPFPGSQSPPPPPPELQPGQDQLEKSNGMQPNDLQTELATGNSVTNPPTNPQLDPKQDQLPVIPAGERPPQPLQVPLNEFGLPPSLIPLHAFHQNNFPHRPEHHINLQPYPYNSYPLIYDQFSQFPNHHHRDPYLPPYGYYPPHIFGVPPQHGAKPNKQDNNPTATPTPLDNVTPEISQQPDISSKNNESTIKEEGSMVQPFVTNGAENKNSNVPDVPPPPLPSGAKKST